MTAALMRRDPGNAFIAIAHFARSLSSAKLLLLESAGFAIALAIYSWAPRQLPFALPFLAVSALGLWGIADHLVAYRYGHRYKVERRLLRVFQAVVAAAGVTTLLLGLFAVVGWAMGVYIS